MLKNHFKIAWRNLKRNRAYSLINIGGLSMGIVVVVLIGLWIHNELSFNTSHKNYDHIARVFMHKTANGQTRTGTVVPFPLGEALRDRYGSNFEHVVMSSYHGDNILSFQNTNFTVPGGFMEPDALRMLSLPMVYGNWNGLADPNSIVISESTSKAFFGEADPIGQPMKIGNLLTVMVTGVYEDLPAHSEFNALKFIAPWDLYAASYDWVRRARDERLWDNNSYRLYVQIAEGTSMQQVSETIKNTIYDNLNENQRSTLTEIFLHPMKDWHLRSDWKNGVNSGGFITYVWLFGIIGIFVLLLACINFMNLSTAQSEKRAREVGIRKSIGSSKAQLIGQFLGEAFLVVTLAYALALIIAYLIMPYFNQVTGKLIEFPLASVSFWGVSLLFIGLTSLLAGSYPALYLSSFKPVKALKGILVTDKHGTSFRKTLVVVQFTVSVVLIIGTLVVQQQINTSKDRPIGYEKDGLVMVEKVTEDYEGKYNRLRRELKKSNAIVEMAASSSPLTGLWSSGGGFEWEGKPADFVTSMFMVSTSHDYGNTIGWDIVQGRDFSREFPTDSTAFILNESAVEYMGLENPIGKIVRWNNAEHKVIGVVKDLVAQSPFQPASQVVYMIDYDNTNWFELKLNPEQSATESLATIETILKKHVPNIPFEYQFVDTMFSEKFVSEERTRTLAGVFAFLAVLISCLGLLGLTSFVAEQRSKEIGVRKVLGASIFNVWKLLSKDFLVLVFISGLVATPLAYYLMGKWLENYHYRIEISWWIFVSAIAGALAITMVTVSFQAIKAATTNPVKSLRRE